MSVKAKRFDKGILIGLFLFTFTSNAIWLNLEHRSPGWDEAVHLNESLNYFEWLKSPDLKVLKTIVSPVYPPLFPLTSAILYFLFGPDINVAYMSNMLFTIIMLVSVQRLGVCLYGRQASFLALFLITFFPIMIQMSHEYWLDYASACMVTLTILLLHLCEGFRNRAWSYAAGSCLGLTLLTRQHSVLFILGPLIHAVCSKYKSNRDACNPSSGNHLPGAAAIAVCMALPYYIFSLNGLKLFIKEYLETGSDHPVTWNSPGYLIRDRVGHGGRIVHVDHGDVEAV